MSNSEIGAFKAMLGLVSIALVSSVAYTVISYPTDLWKTSILFILPIASLYTLFILGPLIAFLIRRNLMSFVIYMGLIGVLTFFIFISWNLFSLGSNVKYVEGGKVFVENGSITSAGYMKSIIDSTITASVVLIGGVVSWISVFRPRKSQRAQVT